MKKEEIESIRSAIKKLDQEHEKQEYWYFICKCHNEKHKVVLEEPS